MTISTLNVKLETNDLRLLQHAVGNTIKSLSLANNTYMCIQYSRVNMSTKTKFKIRCL